MRPRLPCIPSLRRFAAFTPRAPSQTVRGNMRRVIVLNPGGEIFQEAVFVLRDDYLPSGISRQELLRQAKIAAEGCGVSEACAPVSAFFLSPLAVFLLGAACAVIALWLFGLL